LINNIYLGYPTKAFNILSDDKPLFKEALKPTLFFKPDKEKSSPLVMKFSIRDQI